MSNTTIKKAMNSPYMKCHDVSRIYSGHGISIDLRSLRSVHVMLSSSNDLQECRLIFNADVTFNSMSSISSDSIALDNTFMDALQILEEITLHWRAYVNGEETVHILTEPQEVNRDDKK